MATLSGEAAQTLSSATSKWGLDREARAALFRVKTGPECPKGTNLRWQPGLWDSQREREKRERKNYPMKSPNLRHCQPWSQNKGVSKTREELASCGLAPPATRGREAGRQ